MDLSQWNTYFEKASTASVFHMVEHWTPAESLMDSQVKVRSGVATSYQILRNGQVSFAAGVFFKFIVSKHKIIY